MYNILLFTFSILLQLHFHCMMKIHRTINLCVCKCLCTSESRSGINLSQFWPLYRLSCRLMFSTSLLKSSYGCYINDSRLSLVKMMIFSFCDLSLIWHVDDYIYYPLVREKLNCKKKFFSSLNIQKKLSCIF